MKNKEIWEKAYSDEVPKDLENQIFAKVEPEIHRRVAMQGNGWPLWLTFPRILLPAAGVGAAVALISLLPSNSGMPPEGVALVGEEEMLLNADMLAELKILKDLPVLERVEKKEWPRTGS